MCSADQAEAPSWIREQVLPQLNLPADRPVHFVDEKTVTATDLDARQGRFRLPTPGVMRNLRPLLTAEQLQATNLLPTAGKKRGGAKQLQAANLHPTAYKKRGGGKRRHSGLPVLLADVGAGIAELEMAPFESGRGTGVKGEKYMDFIADCSFTVGDVVQIWAFKPRVRPLCLVIAKKPNIPTPS